MVSCQAVKKSNIVCCQAASWINMVFCQSAMWRNMVSCQAAIYGQKWLVVKQLHGELGGHKKSNPK